MSEIFTSSSDKIANTAIATATPPYSSDGPTIPVIGVLPDQNSNHSSEKAAEAGKSSRKRKAQAHVQPTDSRPTTKRCPPPRPPHTLDPALYTPWILLPPHLNTLLQTQARLRIAPHTNVVPIVFSKNQNVKAGINRLKTHLGAYKDPRSSIEMPTALSQEDCLLAVSAQGEGAGKLVGIVDMTRRIVGAGAVGADADAGKTQTWYFYTVLAGVEVEWMPKTSQGRGKGGVGGVKAGGEEDEEGEEEEDEEEEEEAFEAMDVDGGDQVVEERKKIRKVPVLTVWMTRARIAAFAKEFGEQAVVVKMAAEDGD